MRNAKSFLRWLISIYRWIWLQISLSKLSKGNEWTLMWISQRERFFFIVIINRWFGEKKVYRGIEIRSEDRRLSLREKTTIDLVHFVRFNANRACCSVKPKSINVWIWLGLISISFDVVTDRERIPTWETIERRSLQWRNIRSTCRKICSASGRYQSNFCELSINDNKIRVRSVRN